MKSAFYGDENSMRQLVKDMAVLLNKRVLGVDHSGALLLEDGYILELHPYETFVERYDKSKLKKEKLFYYSPSLFE